MTSLSVCGAPNESELREAARYTTWRRSHAIKFMFGLGCFLILTGIASFALGQRENAVGSPSWAHPTSHFCYYRLESQSESR